MENRRPTYEELAAENASLRLQVAKLTVRVEQLMKLLEEKNRSGKRQAAPFSKGEPKKNPEKPGRKSGDDHGQHVRRDIPGHVDEIHAVPLPERCPCCRSKTLQSDHTVTQWQTDIPQKVIVRQFEIQCGHCEDCGAKVRGRHELQTSDAIGAAASQLGPNAHAAIAVLNKEVGLTHGKITRVMKILFGLKVGRATSCRSMLRTSKKCEPVYAQIIEEVRGSPLVKIDANGCNELLLL